MEYNKTARERPRKGEREAEAEMNGRIRKMLALALCLFLLAGASQALGEKKITVKRILGTWLAAGEKAPVTERPGEDSPVLWTLETDRFYWTERHTDQYYQLTSDDGQTGYVSKGKVRIANPAELTGGTLFKLPHVAKDTPRLPVETVLAYGRLTGEDASFYDAETMEQTPLASGTRVYVYSAYGDFAGISHRGRLGYVKREKVTVLGEEELEQELADLRTDTGRLTANPILDQAFAMLEAGNPFLQRYRKLTGSGVKTLFSAGVPYFWGGQDEEAILERYPEYTTRKAWSTALKFYEKGTAYVLGLDCVGFVKGVFENAGCPLKEDINDLNDRAHCRAGQHLYCSERNPIPEDWKELARSLRPGDLLAIHHPGRHVMLFMGTLRDYGYTEEQLPALAEYLDYPLMVHSGENPCAYWRFEALLARTEDSRLEKAEGTVGGASVCILGVPREKAETVIHTNDRDAYAFDVEGACVTIMSFHNVKDYFIWRNEAAENAAGETNDDA